MDSGNSGSLQSSSGGDEEFDSSRADSLTAFLNSSNSNHNMGIMSSTLLQQPSHHQHPSTPFDPLSNYLDVFSQSSTHPNFILNLDMVWPRGATGHGGREGLRSDPNSTQPSRGVLPGLPSSSSPAQAIPNTQQPPGRNPSSKPLPSGPDNSSRPPASSDPNNVPRNTKKRSRASRRAPTTVLTTDTSNFRAMVQEFTGIPAPPFSATPIPRTRLDLFSNASNMRSSFDPSPQPPYLLRPFAHKVQPPSFVSSNIASTTNSAAINTTNTAPTTSTSTTNPTNVSNSNSTTNNYQLSSDQLGLPRQQPQTILNMQNPMPTFQSLLQSPPKYSSSNVPIFGSKSQTHEPIPPPEDLGMSHGHLGTLSNLVSTGGGLSLSRNDNWGERVGSNDADQTHLRSLNGGNYGTNAQRVTSCKMNFSASSSDFHTEKTPENVSTRGEGMVDSWICSSD